VWGSRGCAAAEKAEFMKMAVGKVRRPSIMGMPFDERRRFFGSA
jgi:hypothetical protein